MRSLLVALIALALLPATAFAEQQACTGKTSADGVPQKPGPRLRFGITPGVETGQLATGPQPPRTPEEQNEQLAALHALVPPRVPFLLRFHRSFWSARSSGVKHFLALTRR